MDMKKRNVTIVIMPEQEAKALSVRFSLRCILRDCGYLWIALGGHWRRYRRAVSRGWSFKNHWWTRP
jgi:hypothetical protein